MKSNRKKILLLAPPNSIHTIKWANEIYKKGFDVSVFGLSANQKESYSEGIKIFSFSVPENFINRGFGSLVKLYYLLCLPYLYKVIKQIKPDLIHAHYASSYGVIGSLLRFHPFIISVWGDDVYSFPKQSRIHLLVFKYILKSADRILSTSGFMANEISKYTNKQLDITPFGVDTEKFVPSKQKKSTDNPIVIGIIKGLEFQYGIEYLIESFKVLVERNLEMSLQLMIVGSGSLESKFKKMVSDFGIENHVVFTGFIDNSEIVKYHNMIDIYVSLSIESFGVSIIEAQSCGVPVIVSNKGGTPEVIENEVTGYVVPRKDVGKIVETVEKLIFDESLREKMGINGRKRVIENFEINLTVMKMINIYNEIID